MKLSNMRAKSNSDSKKKNRKMYFKRRNTHLFKSKCLSRLKFQCENTSIESNYKFPILTCIELIDSKLSSTSNESLNSNTSTTSSTKNSILFNDYLLISSKTKYKYLLYTLYEKLNLNSKDNYTIVEGFLKLFNWEPINLNSICSVAQCLDNNECTKLLADKNQNTGGLLLKNYTSSNFINNNKNGNDSDCVTVYDILKHVVSFISIHIRVKLKDDDNDTSGDTSNIPISKVEKKSVVRDRPSCLNQLREKLLEKSRKLQMTNPSSESLDQNSEIQQSFNQDNQNIDKPNDQEGDQNETNDTEQNTQIQNNPFQTNPYFNLNQKMSNIPSNLSALLYTNPQFASLFPMFNLPILTQYLNSFKKPESQLDYSNFIQNKLNQNSTKNSSTNLSVETHLTNNTNESNSKSNNYTSPSSTFSSASSTSSTSSFKPNQTTSDVKHSLSEDFKNSLQSSQFYLLQKQLQKGNGSCSNQNLSKEKKQRERTTFDPHEEITRLMQIFEQTHHPSRYQIANICDSLNSLACRKDKKPLEPYNIQYWFKNARAALRRKSKSDQSTTQGKNANEFGSNEDSKNSFDDFEEDNNLEDLYDSQVKQENLDRSESKINFDYQEDDMSVNDLDNTNQNQTSQNMLHKNVSTNSLSVTKNSGNRRNRVFIDPISEVPILEHYFSIETYPDHYLIEKICDILNKGEYRYKFPKLEARNIQLWFKNHRAKLKRLKGATSETSMVNQSTCQNDKSNYASMNRSKLYNNNGDDVEIGEVVDDYDYGDYENDENAPSSQTIGN
ncbi:unnamed protein product [Brachionus calyciflorus]|uniref:Homeobox domain-containing protein n=1 Tax=Brachionus calyciflorus TaxID=104777 RepID=A0A813QAC3_9BILA|nr:unnamed protein product [Brachionus calyciflorus]